MENPTVEVSKKTIEEIRDQSRWESVSGVIVRKKTKKQIDDTKGEVDETLEYPANQGGVTYEVLDAIVCKIGQPPAYVKHR